MPASSSTNGSQQDARKNDARDSVTPGGETGLEYRARVAFSVRARANSGAEVAGQESNIGVFSEELQATQSDLEEKICGDIRKRLEEKFADYELYNFTLRESSALNILFDLMQEYQSEAYLSSLPVLLLEMLFQLKAEFYYRIAGNKFYRRTPAIGADGWEPPDADKIRDNIVMPKRTLIPVRGRFVSTSQEESDRKIRGLLVLYPESPLDAKQILFFEKFANRLGFSMHNHAMAQKNREHLDFVRNLVNDIGHNVLGPNMYFKLLINKLAAGIIDLGQDLHSKKGDAQATMERLKAAHIDLLDQVNEIQQNFNHSSLFLESLLRESHFTQGRYVLRNTRLNLVERVVKSQYQSYLPLFKAKGIIVDLSQEKDICHDVEADFGLISQVMANMFSNALKYAAAVPEAPIPFMYCSVVRQPRFNGNLDGVRVEVLSSGEAIKQDEAAHLFKKYFRASNTGGVSGTGKGLHFVQDIVLQHKGEVGYEAAPKGNLFYFTLPCAPEEKNW